MITREKVKEYIWAGGDIDGYARSGRRSDIDDADWFLIDRTVSAIGMIRRGQAAQSFKQRHEEQVREDFDSRETYELLVDYEAKSERRCTEWRPGDAASQFGTGRRAAIGELSVSSVCWSRIFQT